MTDEDFDAEMEGCVHVELQRLRAEVVTLGNMADKYLETAGEVTLERDRLREMLRAIVKCPERLKLPDHYSPETEEFNRKLRAALGEEGS